ncbi:hypothetical protein B0H19DRAFT_1372972, partial [Mycena capillaripes]
MLQIPSSVFTLVSFSSKGLVGLFGGFCIGAQLALNIVLSGLSEVPKNSLSFATRTTEIVLLPTKCVLSNGTISFPYVAAMGYATVVFAGLFFILRAKGFSHGQVLPDGRSPSPDYPVSDGSPLFRRAVSPARNHVGMGGQPPSPPSDPGPRCSSYKAPRRNRWMWLLLIYAALALVGLRGYIYFTYPDSRTAASLHMVAFLGTQTVLAVERFIQDGILENGWQLSKIIFLALASHSVCILIFAALRRLRVYVVLFLRVFCLNIGVCLLSLAVIASFPQLNWIIWTFGWYHGALLSVKEINWNMIRFSFYFSSLVESRFLQLLTIVGVIMIHTSFGFIPRVIRIFAIRLHLALRRQDSVLLPALAMYPLLAQYANLDSGWRQHLWQSFYCPQSRETLRAAFQLLFQRQQAWKAIQIRDFHELAPELPHRLAATLKVSWETWCTLALFQKLLTVAPAVIFYSCVYIVPVACRVKLKIRTRNWRRRWH